MYSFTGKKEINCNNISGILNKNNLFDISQYDSAFISKCVLSRIQFNNFTELSDYEAFLDNSKEEQMLLIYSFQNSYSEFFRNSLSFGFIENYIIPGLFARQKRTHTSQLRFWSAGCAEGQESYSLAMLLSEYSDSLKYSNSYRIFATDYSVNAVEKAKEGVFDISALQNLKLSYLSAFFDKQGKSYKIKNSLKSNIDFSVHNLLDERFKSPPSSIYGDFDFIICCNLLMYYNEHSRNVILSVLTEALKPGGFLVVSEAEKNIPESSEKLVKILSPMSVFKKL